MGTWHWTPITRCAVAGAVTFAVSSSLATITIHTAPVGDFGNAPDPTTGYGSVAYAYSIGTTEVTNAQYAAFLNAVAATDSNNLYSIGMAWPFGGITRSGSPGSYTYATIAGRENNPVNYVSFWDACRFANWLHNGQPTGLQSNSTTEDGAYTLTPTGIANNTVTRNAGWLWAVTSENEWYKAAYHQPANQGGDADNHWLYPTSSNTITTVQANYNNVIGDTTPVGSYAANFYGTFDMGGNAFEWNEALINGSNRGIRGGSFSGNDIVLRASFRYITITPTSEVDNIGFRVASNPRPCSGDVNYSGGTNVADFNILASNFGESVTPGTDGDLTGDGLVNVADFNILASDFGCQN